MEIGEKFKNIESYNTNMAKGMEDKLFFLDYLKQVDGNYVFVDFGCADGTLIDVLYHLRPHDKYIGYDISEQMIDLAKTKRIESPRDMMFTFEWNEVEDKLKAYTEQDCYKTVLILSSVIHEVYSYANNSKDIFGFWDKVLNTGFDYICVRDMMIPKDATKTKSPGKWINNIQIEFQKFMTNERYKEFEEIWGPLDFKTTTKQEALHFFLKYRWQINWDREVHENYFPITIEDFLQMFKEKYNLDYFERFCVPFIKYQISKDFFITLDDKDSTHIKAIFSSKSNV